jgi:antitoxin VapB
MAALNIKDPETHELAMELAHRKGTSITEAVRESLRLSVVRARHEGRLDSGLVERVMAIGRRAAARPVLDNRTSDEILGYDEIGIPRG